MPWGAIERYQTLAAAQSLLPPGHPEDLQQRCVLQELPICQAPHELADAARLLPARATAVLQPNGDKIVVFSGALQASAGALNLLPCYTPFGSYMDECLGAPEDTALPDLPGLEHPLRPNFATTSAETPAVTLSPSTWVTAQQGRLRVVSGDAAIVASCSQDATQVLLGGPLGLHALFTPTERSQQANARNECAAEDGRPTDTQVAAAPLETANEGKDEPKTSDEAAFAASPSVSFTVCTPTGCLVTVDQGGSITVQQHGSSEWRSVLADGTVVCGGGPGGLQAWLPDGSKLEQAEPRIAATPSASGENSDPPAVAAADAPAVAAHALTSWLATALDGTRIEYAPTAAVPDEAEAVPEGADADAEPNDRAQAATGHAARPREAVGCCVRRDADSGAEIRTWDDLTTRISLGTAAVVEHRPDGSRYTRHSDGEWTVESPAMPTIHGDADKLVCTLQHGVEAQWSRVDGSISLTQQGGVRATCCGELFVCGAPLASRCFART